MIVSPIGTLFRSLGHEVIIVDDASTDGSRDLIDAYVREHKGWVSAILHDQNRGISRTRNDAIKTASGDYLSYVDGDDRWLPEKLEKESQALSAAGADAAFSNHYNMRMDGTHNDQWANGEPMPEGDVFEATWVRAFPRRDIFRMELVRTELMREIGAYDEQLPLYEDFDMRMRLTRHAKLCYVDFPLAEIRRHDQGLSGGPRREAVKALNYIWKKNMDLLRELSPATRRRIRRGYFGWMAPVCRDAAYEWLYSDDGRSVSNRMHALQQFLRCGRYAPDRLTVGDLMRVFLPDSLAQNLANRSLG